MAQMTAASIDDLPDSDFAYIEPGGKKDASGRTVPRSLRHFPINDAAHVRNALARAPQSPFGDKAMPKIRAAAKRFNIDAPQKAVEMKAEPMSTAQLDRWLAGKTPRRILVLPFGGPLPKKGAPLGVDLDGEWFDADTDIYGDFRALRASRDRLVDWHHDSDPTGRMKGAIIGHVVLDEEPEDDGVWADFWANAGEKRRNLVAQLERQGVLLYGSSEAVPHAVKKADSGHIDVWPLVRHTITTSPQNTWAVVPPLKALLTAEDFPLEEIGTAALKAALLGLDSYLPELRAFASDEPDDATVKAGRVLSATNEAALRRALEEMTAVLGQLAKYAAVEDPE